MWVSISHYAVCNLEAGWPAVLDCLELRTSQHVEFLALKLGQLVTLCTVPKLPCSWYLLCRSSLKPSTSLRSVPVPSPPTSSSSLSTFLPKWMDWANWSQTLRYKSMWSVSSFHWWNWVKENLREPDLLSLLIQDTVHLNSGSQYSRMFTKYKDSRTSNPRRSRDEDRKSPGIKACC